MASYNISAVELWKPVHSQFDNLQNISIPEKLKDLDDVPINKLVEKLESVRTVNPMFDIWGLPTLVYILIGMGCALILGIILFAYCKSKKRWSGKLWRRSKSSEKRVEAGFPLVTINSSDDGNAGRDTYPSAPVYSTVVDHKDTIKKLYPLVITDSDPTKREQQTD